jgi:signal transduction histidine kinase
MWRRPPEDRHLSEGVEVVASLASYYENVSVIFQTDFNADLLHANPPALEYVGLTLDELGYCSLYDFVREDCHTLLDTLFALGEFRQPMLIKGLYLKGRSDEHLVRFYRHDAFGATLIIFIEVAATHAVILAEEEHKWAERLQIMLFGLNHELKTPLATARGYLDLLEISSESEDVDLSTSLEGTRTALLRMSQILNDMTAPMRELTAPQGAFLDLGHALNNYVQTMSFVEPTKRYVGVFSMENDLAQDKLIEMSGPRFSQVLTNLFDNAMRATKGLEEEASIRILTHMCNKPHHPNCIVLSFTDNGCGMDANTLKQVFTPYFTTRDVDTGSGLGLYFVYHFVRSAGGTIDAESTVGEGTTLHLHLPYHTEES